MSPRRHPNPTLTPGEAAETISVRRVGLRLKRTVYRSYGVSLLATRGYVIDHLIPLELCGTNGIKNLWPQPKHEAQVKDLDENRLADLVAIRSYSYAEAQAEILKLWS